MASDNLTPSTQDWSIPDVPEVNLDTNDEKKTARLSKTRAWKQIDSYLEDRKKFFQLYLPGVNPAIKGTNEDWQVAHSVVLELEALRQYVDTIANGVS